MVKRAPGEPDPFELNATRSELKVPGTLLSDVKTRSLLCGALGLSEEDLGRLIDSSHAVVTADKKLTLKNLSRLFRSASLSRALGLSIEDFLTARALIAVAPFVEDGQPVTATRVEDTLAFADKVAKVRAAGFSYSDLDYLLRNRGTAAFAPDANAIASALGDIRDAVRQTPAVLVSQDVNAAQALALTTAGRTEAIAQKLHGALNVDVSIARYFLSDWPDRPTVAAHRMTDIFLDPDFCDEDAAVTATRYPELFLALTRFIKVLALAASLRLSREELLWTARNSSSLGWLAFQSLPADASEPAASFEDWERMTDFFSWIKELPRMADASFLNVLEISLSFTGSASAAKQRVLEEAAGAGGWPLADLEVLLGVKDQTLDKGLLGFQFPSDYKDERLWQRLLNGFGLLKRLGASAVQGRAWVADSLTQDDARAAKQAAKSKHEESQWLALAKPLRDTLREK